MFFGFRYWQCNALDKSVFLVYLPSHKRRYQLFVSSNNECQYIYFQTSRLKSVFLIFFFDCNQDGAVYFFVEGL